VRIELAHSGRIVAYQFLHDRLGNASVFQKTNRGMAQGMKRKLTRITSATDSQAFARALGSHAGGVQQIDELIA
jgi:hypothetical protein